MWGTGGGEWKALPGFHLEIVISMLVGAPGVGIPRDVGRYQVVVSMGILLNSKDGEAASAVAVVVLIVGRPDVEDGDTAPAIFLSGMGVPMNVAENL